MDNYQYFLPTKIIFGRGSLSKLTEIVSQFNLKKILLVVGGHLKKDGTVEKLIPLLGTRSVVYPAEITKSDLTTVNQLASFCRSEKPDLIIAVGGGSVLDSVKSAAVLMTNPGLVEDYVISKRRKITLPGVLMVAIPTTAGTGGEVTPWSVIWNINNKRKYSLSSPLMFPKVAIVDSRLTDNLSPKLTASTGMDALAQAIEAYWSKNHNPISDLFALEAIRLISANLEKTVKHGNNIDSRQQMAKAALFAGLAFSNTKTTICHSVSYPLTARFDIPHGHAVALTLASFLEFSFNAIEKRRGEKLLRAMSVANVKQACRKITNLMRSIGMKMNLSQFGIKEKDIKTIVAEGFTPERADNAPRIPSSEELYDLLKKIF